MIKSRSLDGSNRIGSFSNEYMKVWEFVFRYQSGGPAKTPFHWGRWEWMHSLPYLDEKYLDRIFVWEEEQNIVGLLTYESNFGEAFYLIEKGYSLIKEEIMDKAIQQYDIEGFDFRILIPDEDIEMKMIAVKKGLRPTRDSEMDALIDLKNQDLSYSLPEGFHVTSMQKDFDMLRYNEVLWRGFNHEGEPDSSKKNLEERRVSLSGPHVALDRNIAIVSPDGKFVSYSGTFYKEGSPVALVEPVATDPDFRKMGLGKAAVLEAMKRCRDAGALYGLVGSDQQFYYNIGFVPHGRYTWWKKNN